MTLYGLVGKSLKHSFSQNYFRQKFEDLSLVGVDYLNFEFQNLSSFKEWIEDKDAIRGFNITVPYKTEIIEHLDDLDEAARRIGAVNTVKITDGILKGYNTDRNGFLKSLDSFLPHRKFKALMLGSGGSSKAVADALNEMGIKYKVVSRTPSSDQVSYEEANENLVDDHFLIINCTPIGMFPNRDSQPGVDTSKLGSDHYVFDLIYNPSETRLMKEARAKGAEVKNGLEMLKLQAEAAWEIWNK